MIFEFLQTVHVFSKKLSCCLEHFDVYHLMILRKVCGVQAFIFSLANFFSSFHSNATNSFLRTIALNTGVQRCSFPWYQFDSIYVWPLVSNENVRIYVQSLCLFKAMATGVNIVRYNTCHLVKLFRDISMLSRLVSDTSPI